MRILNKQKHEQETIKEFNSDMSSVVISDPFDFIDLTGVGIEIPLYIIEGLTLAGKLNEFLTEIKHAPLDVTPYYTVLKSIMQGTDLTDTDKVQFLVMVANLWDWNGHFYNLTDCVNVLPDYALIAYVIGVLGWEDTDEFIDLVCDFFSGDIDTPTFFNECNKLKNE